MRTALGLGLLAGLAALTACQSPRPSPAAGGPAAPAAPSASSPAAPPPAGLPADAPLAAEARWLGELFGGTPVQVSGERDGSVRLSVPLKFAFEASAVAPRPPLQAVLDKLSLSLKRQPGPGCRGRRQRAPPPRGAWPRSAATWPARASPPGAWPPPARRPTISWRCACCPRRPGSSGSMTARWRPRGAAGCCRRPARARRAEPPRGRADRRGSRSGTAGRRPAQADPAVDGGPVPVARP